MRENRTPGSVQGRSGNWPFYCDGWRVALHGSNEGNMNMTADNALESPVTRKTYYSRARTGTLVVLGALLLLTLAIWLIRFVSNDGEDVRFRATLGVAYVLFSSLYLYRVWCDRIVISPEGLEYYRAKYCISTTWSNIERIAEAQVGQEHVDVLILREPSLRLNNWLTRLSSDDRLSWIEHDAQFIPPGKAIPISLDFNDWRNSGLGRDIQRHLPHLMISKSAQPS